MAVEFEGNDDWEDSGTGIAPGDSASPPSILTSLGLYQEDPNDNTSYQALSGKWSDVRDVNFGASLAYTGTKGSGVPEVAARPNHEGASVITKTIDSLSPKLFGLCNTGNMIAKLVMYHPGLNTVMLWQGVNLTQFHIDAALTAYWNFYDFAQTNNVWGGDALMTRHGQESIQNMWETFRFVYDEVSLWVNGVEFSWSVETSSVPST